MEEGERKQPGVAREYRSEQIVVYWEPAYCIHTARCLEGLPQVFDVRRRPWIDITAASADAIAGVVAGCPTGALSFARLDGGPQEQAPADTEVTVWRNGPLFLRGRIRIVGADGSPVREATRVALCRCGGSDNKPFCDGTHRANGFRAP
ncbi:MAG: (4Fe-4S)-binding protein [Dehalococcoidia bacterium]|nr:(4Fe-4S)-binding protein [Dehalococcoidia bacterium]